jgi:hypothetical protein
MHLKTLNKILARYLALSLSAIFYWDGENGTDKFISDFYLLL